MITIDHGNLKINVKHTYKIYQFTILPFLPKFTITPKNLPLHPFLGVWFSTIKYVHFVKILWNRSSEFFHSAKLKFFTHQTPPLFLLSQPYNHLFYLLFLWIWLFQVSHISRIIWYLWLAYFISIMSSRFIYIVACNRIFLLFSGWIIFHYMYIACFIFCSSVGDI